MESCGCPDDGRSELYCPATGASAISGSNDQSAIAEASGGIAFLAATNVPPRERAG